MSDRASHPSHGLHEYRYPDGTPVPYTPEDVPDFGTWDAVLMGDYP